MRKLGTRQQIALKKRQKIMSILRKTPATVRELADFLRKVKFLDYSFWIHADIRDAVEKLKDTGRVEFKDRKWHIVR